MKGRGRTKGNVRDQRIAINLPHHHAPPGGAQRIVDRKQRPPVCQLPCHAIHPASQDTSTPQLAPAQHISNEGSTPSSHAHRLRTQQSYLLLGGLAAVRRLSPPAADLPHLSATAPEVGPRVMQCPCMRPATHAGSWYCAEGPELASDITQWLAAAAAAAVAAVPAAVPSHPAPEPEPPPRAIIGPHAGFAYSGPTAAHAYQHVRPEGIRRVFVLGPSHHVFLRACATSAATSYETPLGELPVDVATTKALQATSQFKVMSPETDGAEHSIELHLPFVRHCFRGRDIQLVPIMVGSLTHELEASYGELLAPYLDQPDNFFVVSSDFCHWGQRFDFVRYDEQAGSVSQSIEALDKEGMSIIEHQDAAGFGAYIDATRNTICGRHPISVLLHAMHFAKTRFRTRFTHYAQSGPVHRPEHDSSVSYASATVTAIDQSDDEQ